MQSMEKILKHRGLVFFAFAASAALSSSSPAAEAAPPLLLDLSPYSEALCAFAAEGPNSTWLQRAARFWDRGLFSAGLQVEVLESEEDERTTLDYIAQLAKRQAQSRKHLAYAVGSCKTPQKAKRYWWASQAAPLVVDREVLAAHRRLAKAAGEHCAGFKILHAPPSSKDRNSTQSFKALKPALDAGSGILSLTCQPKDSRLGPVLWAIIPLQADSETASSWSVFADVLKESAELDGLKAQKISPAALQAWIAKQRAAVKSSPQALELVDPPFLAKLQSLDHRQGIRHDRRHLSEVRRLAQRQGLVFLGEDRVEGESLEALATMLWLSPSHRRLLLRSDAEKIALYPASDAGRLWVILLFAKARPADRYSKSPSPARQSARASSSDTRSL